MTTNEVEIRSAFFAFRTFNQQEEKMYIEKKKTGLDVLDLITLVQRKGGVNTGFPYKSFVCRCSNCLYSTKGKCALKECCCMDERIRAHTCTFGEMMRYCFSGIGDNVFQFRLRLAIEREAELKSCFLDAGHRKRFYVDTGVKIIIAVVVGAVILGGLYALFDTVILPTLETRIDGMFDYAG